MLRAQRREQRQAGSTPKSGAPTWTPAAAALRGSRARHAGQRSPVQGGEAGGSAALSQQPAVRQQPMCQPCASADRAGCSLAYAPLESVGRQAMHWPCRPGHGGVWGWLALGQQRAAGSWQCMPLADHPSMPQNRGHPRICGVLRAFGACRGGQRHGAGGGPRAGLPVRHHLPGGRGRGGRRKRHAGLLDLPGEAPQLHERCWMWQRYLVLSAAGCLEVRCLAVAWGRGRWDAMVASCICQRSGGDQGGTSPAIRASCGSLRGPAPGVAAAANLQSLPHISSHMFTALVGQQPTALLWALEWAGAHAGLLQPAGPDHQRQA